MPAKLNGFEDTKHIRVNGECKKLKTWRFESQKYCVRRDRNPSLILVFEDETEEYAKNIPELENC